MEKNTKKGVVISIILIILILISGFSIYNNYINKEKISEINKQIDNYVQINQQLQESQIKGLNDSEIVNEQSHPELTFTYLKDLGNPRLRWFNTSGYEVWGIDHFGNGEFLGNINVSKDVYISGTGVSQWLYNQTLEAYKGNGTFVPYVGAIGDLDMGGNGVYSTIYYATSTSGLEYTSLGNVWFGKYSSGIGADNTGLYFNVMSSELQLMYLNNPQVKLGIDGHIIAGETNVTSLNVNGVAVSTWLYNQSENYVPYTGANNNLTMEGKWIGNVSRLSIGNLSTQNFTVLIDAQNATKAIRSVIRIQNTGNATYGIDFSNSTMQVTNTVGANSQKYPLYLDSGNYWRGDGLISSTFLMANSYVRSPTYYSMSSTADTIIQTTSETGVNISFYNSTATSQRNMFATFAPRGDSWITNNFGTGEFGLYTRSPKAKLDVNGSSLFEGDLNITGIIYVNGTNANIWLYNQSGGGSFVPYTGATANVDLGYQNLTSQGNLYYGAEYAGAIGYDDGVSKYAGGFASPTGEIYLGYNDGVNDEWLMWGYGGNSQINGSFGLGISPAQSISIDAPTNVVATINYDTEIWSGADGYNFTYKVVACKTPDIPGVGYVDVCSEPGESNTAQVVGSGGFDINVTVEFPPDTEYAYAFVKDEMRGANYDYYLLVGGNFADGDTFTFGASPDDFTNSPYVYGGAGSVFYYNNTAETIVMKTETTNIGNFVVQGDLNVSGTIYGTLGGYIPYTGANQNIDLGSNEFKVNYNEGIWGLFVNKSTGSVGIGSRDTPNMFDIYNSLGNAGMSIRADNDRASYVDMMSGNEFFRFGKECSTGGCLVSNSMPYENYFYSGGSNDLSFYTNSFFVGGFNGTTGSFSVGGRNPKTDLDVFGNATIRENLSVEQHVNIKGNLVVLGNLSAKRPYYYGYDNSTQNFINTGLAQKMNLTNNADVDSYMITINSSHAIKFQQTGDYKCLVSPEFFQSSGGSALVTFWMRKNGADVKWSNSRYTVPNNGYNAPTINFPFDITNPATDYVEFYWWSDSTSTQLYSSGALTSPTRPSIPGVLIQCDKMSEITP